MFSPVRNAACGPGPRLRRVVQFHFMPFLQHQECSVTQRFLLALPQPVLAVGLSKRVKRLLEETNGKE